MQIGRAINLPGNTRIYSIITEIHKRCRPGRIIADPGHRKQRITP